MLYALKESGASITELGAYCDDSDKEATLYEVVRDIYDDYFREEIEEAEKLDYDMWDRADEAFERMRDGEVEKDLQ